MPRATPKKKAEVLPRPPYNPTVPIGYWTVHNNRYYCPAHKPTVGSGESIIGLTEKGVDRAATAPDRATCTVCGVYL